MTLSKKTKNMIVSLDKDLWNSCYRPVFMENIKRQIIISFTYGLMQS